MTGGLRAGVLAAALALSACGARRAEEDAAPPARPALSEDPDFSCKHLVFARRYSLESGIAPGPLKSFSRLTPAQRESLDGLIRGSRMRTEVLLLDGRMLLTLPSGHPAGGLELLLAEDLGRLVAFDLRNKRRHVLPLSRFPDVLEGAPTSARDSYRLALDEAPRPPRDPQPPPGIRTRPFSAAISLRHLPQARSGRAEPLRVEFRALLADQPGHWPAFEPLLQVAFPQLQTARGRPLLEHLAHRMARPLLFWTRSVINKRYPAPARTTTWTRVRDQGHQRIPLCRLSVVRRGYSDAPGDPQPAAAGRQLIPAVDLASLRPARPAGSLRVRNNGLSSALVYLDGALLGWVAPGRVMAFEGIPAGFFNVHARTPTGLRAWGPLELYVPGPLTLR
jgi:hypothetical protein